MTLARWVATADRNAHYDLDERFDFVARFEGIVISAPSQ